MLNVAVIMGRLVADPELRRTTTGKDVTAFRVAVDRAFGEKKADFIDVVAWESTAGFVARYFKKGSPIAVNGRLQQRSYEDKNGNKRSTLEIVADNVSFCGGKETFEGEKTNPVSVEVDDDGELPF